MIYIVIHRSIPILNPQVPRAPCFSIGKWKQLDSNTIVHLYRCQINPFPFSIPKYQRHPVSSSENGSNWIPTLLYICIGAIGFQHCCTFVSVPKRPNFWFWCQSDPEWPPQDSNSKRRSLLFPPWHHLSK